MGLHFFTKGVVTLVDWLFKEDEYIVREDKDKFLDNSIFSILKILSKIKRNSGEELKGGFYNINPVVKLFFTILVIVLTSISRDLTFISIIFTAALCSIFFLRKIHIVKIFTLVIISLAFTAIMLVPSMLLGNIKNSILILIKLFITVSLVNILSYSTKWNETSKALKVFFVPDIFILVLEITLKYIYILGEAALEMFYALKLRSVGRNTNKYTSLSGIIGSLFLKSKEMGEEMYSAMECRGFTGEYSSKLEVKITISEIVYSICNTILITAFIFLR